MEIDFQHARAIVTYNEYNPTTDVEPIPQTQAEAGACDMNNEEKKIIKFKLEGKGITPDSLGKGLIDFLQNIFILTEAYNSNPIGITAVENNCITVQFLVPVAFSFALFGSPNIINPQISINQVVNSVANMNKLLASRNATMYCYDNDSDSEYVKYDGCNHKIPVILVDSPIKSIISLYGELVDVGGSGEANIHLKTSIQKKAITLGVTKELARRLAPKLYSSIGVQAEVSFLKGDIIKGCVLAILDYAPQPLESWLKKDALPVLGREYQNINVDDFLDSLRGGTESHE